MVLAGVAVGLGFEAKMAAALLVVPAIAAAWLYAAPHNRIKGLLAGGAAMTVTGLAWPILMWLTPAADRPWVSGTGDNSIWSLILGYNGLGRLLGQDGGPGGGGGPGGSGVFGGDPGVLRLLNAALGGQAGWLLGIALGGSLALLALTKLKRTDPRTGWLLAVGGAAATAAIAFSGAEGIFHPYYVAQLAPLTAALVGAAVPVMIRSKLAAPAIIVAGVLVQVLVLRDTGPTWLPPLLAAGGVGVAVLLGCDVVKRRAVPVTAVMAALLLAPASWSVQTLGHATSGTFPAGGPATTGQFGGGGGTPFGGNTSALADAVAYAQANGGGTIAVSSQSGAAGQLITDGADVAAIGGFSGRESEVSLEWLAQAVADGRIRYVLTEGANGLPDDGRTGASEVMAAVEALGAPTSVDGLYDLEGVNLLGSSADTAGLN
jgi:4-amino-4-deoxy-L-arabinose transferase-like glycosyltransferase